MIDAPKLAAALSAMLLIPGNAAAAGLEPGAYEVTFRLEVPPVERYATDATVRVCVRAGTTSLPVLSANNPLRFCPAENVRVTGNRLGYDILCPGRRNDRSQAHAEFHLAAGGFTGRIAMVMGGKNMTFTEVQQGRRVGACAVAAASLTPR